MALESGSRLGPYEVVGLLASGGMGEVYRARDPRLERDVAIKVLPEQVADPKQLRRFEQEARAAGALNHPNVLAVHDVGTHDSTPYVVSELLEGHTLKVGLEGGALPVRKALEYALEIARGLAAAHDKGIVHRDLKPDNVFVTNDGRIKILDFGLAKLTRPTPLVREGDQGRATESGVVLGTVGFMSPEQVRGEAVDHRSDIFSFGALLYEMLTGVRAFRRDSAVETMNAILKEDPPEVSSTRRGISPGVAGLVSRCLEKRAGDRFRSAHDLALALEAASSGLSGPWPERGSAAAFAVSLWRSKRRLLVALAAVGLAAGGVYRVLVRSPAPSVEVIDSVAVLPFENVGGDPDREYLSDGVADALLNALSRLPDLKVIARSTSFRFRGKEVDPRQVGRDLKVGAVLTGRVTQRGDTLVIGAELVDVAQGTQLWGERYNTRMADISTLQQDIARDISRKLRRKVAPRDETSLTTRHTGNSEAYRLYLLSRYHYSIWTTPEGLKRAVEYAQQSIEKDPTYAPAYTALANSYIVLGIIGQLSNRDALSRARTAAMTALEIDESLPEAHFDLAQVQSGLDWDWAGAERGFKRALELDPNSADAHGVYSFHLAQMGRFEESMAHARRAVELDPLAPPRGLGRRQGIGLAYFVARQFDQALRAEREALEFDSNLGKGSYMFGWVYREKGMYEEAIAEFRKLLKQSPRAAAALAHLGNTYARAGRVREARECIRQLKQRSDVETVETYAIAIIHAGLGEKDQAFEWLEKAYEVRDQGLSFLKVDPTLDPLRSDPRFQDLVRRMNFPS